jgi:glycosyltransferase involved in cell wall biosynthesis
VNVLHLDTGRTWRGGQAQVLALMRGLARLGHDSLLLAPPGPLLARVLADGLSAREWTSRGDLDLRAGARARRAIGDFRPGLVHAHTAHAHLPGARVARRIDVPLVVARRVAAPVGRNPLSRWKYGDAVARYLCVSHAVVEVMARSGVPRDRLAWVPSGIDLDALARDRERAAQARNDPVMSLRAMLGAPRDAPVAGTVAALTPEKGPDAWFAAAAAARTAAPRLHWVWIGEGPRREDVARRVRRLGLSGHVHLPGFRDDARVLLGQCTVAVVPSRSEGLGTVVLEAQALGVPVVATRSGGVEDAIENGVTGALVSSDAIATAVLDVLAHPERGEAWALEAARRVRGFGVEAMVERTVECYRDVLKDAKPEG